MKSTKASLALQKKYGSGKYLRLTRHLLFWLIYIIINSLFYGVEKEGFMIWEHIADHIISLPIYFFATYFTAYFLVPRLLLQSKRYFQFVVLFLMLLLFSGLLELFKTIHINPVFIKTMERSSSEYQFNIFGITRGCFFILLPLIAFNSLKYLKNWYETNVEKAALEHKHLNSELHLLKSQLHPQFLLTTLENLKRAANTDPKKAAPGIYNIAEMLSFILYEFTTQKTELTKEIRLIRNYIDLQKLNNPDNVDVSFSIIGPVNGINLPPMMLFTMVEYLFKCSETEQDKAFRVNLFLEVSGREVDFWTECHYCPEIITASHSDSSLQNLRKRLGILYPQDSKLDLRQIRDKFVLHLHLKP